VFEKTEPTYETVPFLHVGKTGGIGVDARMRLDEDGAGGLRTRSCRGSGFRAELTV